MPRLIVDDAGQKKAFRVSKGRLSIGSDDSAKLKLTADGVEPQHATLIVRPDSVEVHVEAPVVIDGKTVESGDVDLVFGATLAIGGATISVEADAPETKPMPAKPAGSARSKASGGANKPAAKGGKAGAGARKGAGGGKAGGGRASGGRKSGGRASQRGAEKQGLPAWVPFVGVVIALSVGVWFFSGFNSGSKAASNMLAAAEHLENGKLVSAEDALSRVNGDKLKGEKKDEYEALLDQLAGRKAFKAGAEARLRAMREVDEQLKGLVDRQFKEDPPEPAKVRLLWDRIAAWRAQWPMHEDPIWLEDANWANDMAWIAEMESKYGSIVAKNAPYTLADAEFRAYYFLDPDTKRYNLVMPVVEAAARNTTEEGDRELLEGLLSRLKEEQTVYAQKRFDEARTKFEGGEDVASGAMLVLDIRTLTEPALVERSASLLIGFPRAVQILEGYARTKPEVFAELMQNSTIAGFVRTNAPELLEDQPQG